MDDLIKLRAADTLLGRGVRVASLRPSLFWKLLGAPKKIILHQPTIAELIEMSAIIVKMDIKGDELQKINLTDSYFLVNGSAYKAIEAMIILMRLKRCFITRKRVIKILTQQLTALQFNNAWRLCVLHSGVADFTNTTRLIMTMINLNPMNQRSSQQAQLSV
ncbi:MAG: hypothetical protein RR921_02370 [Mucinivorans sp.]